MIKITWTQHSFENNTTNISSLKKNTTNTSVKYK